MSTPDAVEALFMQWQHAFNQGQNPPLEELCKDRPDLIEALRPRIDAWMSTQGRGQATNVSVSPHAPIFSMGPRAGAEPVAGYRLVAPLGRGAFGQVWKATGPGGFSVAIKMIPLDSRAENFELRSLELMKDIRHAHLLALFGAWRTDDMLIIAMELADRTLTDRFQELRRQGQTGIPFAELVEYMSDAARGIDFLNEPRHKLGDKEQIGIQHRDIKPQNLLLVGGSVKIADFGLAKLLEQTAASNSGSMTIAYAAPECFRGQTSARSDQYSLAVSYCQLRGGQLPFEGSIAEMIGGHVSMTPNLAMLPEAERPVVARSLAKMPDDRWPTCRAFVAALAAAGFGAAPIPTTDAVMPMLPGLDSNRSGPTQVAGSGSVTQTDRTVTERIAIQAPARRSGEKAVLALAAIVLLAGAGAAAWYYQPWQWQWAALVSTEQPTTQPLAVVPNTDPTTEEQPRAVALCDEAANALANGDAARALQCADEAVRLDPNLARAYCERGRVRQATREYAKAHADFTESLQREPCPTVYGERAAVSCDQNNWLQAIADADKALELDAEDAKALVVRGRARSMQGSWTAALQDFHRAWKIDPNLAPLYGYRALTYAHRSEFTQAAADADQAIQLDGESALLYTLRGEVAGWRRDFTAAIPDFTKAIELDPRFAQAYYGRGLCHYGLRDYAKAVADYSKALEIAPGNLGCLLSRAEAHTGQAHSDAAKDDYRQVVELATDLLKTDPQNPWAYRCRGLAYRHLGQGGQGVADYTRAIEFDPKFRRAYGNRGQAYAADKDYDKAIADAAKLIEQEPRDVWALTSRAFAYRSRKDPGDADRAIGDYSEAISFHPNYAVAYRGRGDVHLLDRKDYEKAIADYTRAIELDPGYPHAYGARGVAYAGQKEFDKAIADYTKGIALDPKYAYAFCNRGVAYLNRKDNDKALADLNKAIELNPKYTFAYGNRAQVRSLRREYDRAIDDLKKILDHLDPEYGGARPRLAAAYTDRGLSYGADAAVAAISDFTQAIAADARYVSAYYNRGLAYARRQEYVAAYADYSKAIDIDPKHALAYYHRADISAIRNDYEKAVADCTKAIECNPNLAAGFARRAHYRNEQGKYDDAISDADAAVHISPQYAWAYFQGAFAYSRKKEYRKAIAQYTKAIECDPKYVLAYNNRGLNYEMVNEPDSALGDFTRCIEIDPKYPPAYNSRGLLYAQRKEYDKALPDFTKVIELDRKPAYGYNNRGWAHECKKEYDKAIADYTKAIELDPKYALAYENRGNAYAKKGDKKQAEDDHKKAKAIREASGIKEPMPNILPPRPVPKSMTNATSPDGRRIARADAKNIDVTDAASQKLLWRVTHQTKVTVVAYTPDGKYVATGCDDGAVRILDAATGKEFVSMRCAAGIVSLSVSQDSKQLTDKNSNQRIWDVATGKLLKENKAAPMMLGD
ncbi:MAG: tetratricopeptide repeat protein [Gemmataceae bacterium]|nr:tetratricopeptide repeat protein [Gemmataceae bacterium]